MAKKAAAAPSHAVSIGQSAHAAMQGASAKSAVGTVGGTMNFNNNPRAQQENFTPVPGSYKSKSTKQG